MRKTVQPVPGSFSDRPSAEALLGLEYDFRPCQIHDNTARGISEIPVGGSMVACTAYSIGGGNFASGLLIDRLDGSTKLILTDGDTCADQSQLAEAVDFWERDNSNLIFCLHEKSCGAILFTGDGDARRFLLIRMNLGHCGLPKGHVEKFETEEEAALREISEETGVVARIIPGFRGVVEYPISAKTRKTSVYFIARFDGGDVRIQESEIKGYKLCDYAEALDFITHGNDRAVFVDAVDFLAGCDPAT